MSEPVQVMESAPVIEIEPLIVVPEEELIELDQSVVDTILELKEEAFQEKSLMLHAAA